LSNLSKIFRAYGYKMAEKALSHMLLKLINNRAYWRPWPFYATI
jgi:hypothetical protein